MKIAIVFLVWFGPMILCAQEPTAPADSSGIYRAEALYGFFDKLAALERGDSLQLNIVHIGDSHIQADLLTAALREKFQLRFGNAGRGLVFPYRAAGTNGPSDYTAITDASWQSHRNIHAPGPPFVGISGIGLWTHAKEPLLGFDVKHHMIHQVRWIGEVPPMHVARLHQQVAVATAHSSRVHRIKSGETLSGIAAKYDIGLNELKRINGLKSHRIQAGKTLKISSIPKAHPAPKSYDTLAWQQDSIGHFVRFDSLVKRVSFIGKREANEIVFSGANLSSGHKGVLYHNIGVNGAKLSDYLKYETFFDQLPQLQPDLLVVSLGTNESFDRWEGELYKERLLLFISALRQRMPKVAILVKTPPFSQFKNKQVNPYLKEYAAVIVAQSHQGHFAVADNLHWITQFGTANQLVAAGYLGRDRVHYTKEGYYWQADLFFNGLMQAFEEFKTLQP